MGKGMTVATISRIQRLRKARRDLYTRYSAASSRDEKGKLSRMIERTSATLREISGDNRFI